MYPVTTPAAYNYNNNSMVQKNYLNPQNLQQTPPPAQIQQQPLPPPLPPQASHQSIHINSNSNYNLNNNAYNIPQQNSPSQNQYYEMNGNNTVYYPNPSVSNPMSGSVNRYKNMNDEVDHLSINRTLG